MVKWVVGLILLIILIVGSIFFLNKSPLFITPNEAKYYKANPQKTPNYYKGSVPRDTPNYYKANPKNAPNYVNPNINPPENYIKAPEKKPKSIGAKTLEAVGSGFKK